MRREYSNYIRFVMEEMTPPFIRDSAIFRLLALLSYGRDVDVLADFRKRAAFVTELDYERVYRQYKRVHDKTDNSEACIEEIEQNLIGQSLCDVGCGSGFLLRAVTAKFPGRFSRVAGVDFVLAPTEDATIEFVEAKIEHLPFEDSAFDTVICTHVIEHILDYRVAIAELRRITARRLIVVVPQEREAIYTFNPHFNFFPYPHSFLRAMIPVPEKFECKIIGRDIYYREDK